MKKREQFEPITAPKRTPRPPPIPHVITPDVGVDAARAVLQRVLLDMRDAKQGGYSRRCRGRWDFVSTSIGQLAPEELDALFTFAGIVPDEIETVGECSECANSDNGKERGYTNPCVACLRPSHINHFVARERLTRKSK